MQLYVDYGYSLGHETKLFNTTTSSSKNKSVITIEIDMKSATNLIPSTAAVPSSFEDELLWYCKEASFASSENPRCSFILGREYVMDVFRKHLRYLPSIVLIVIVIDGTNVTSSRPEPPEVDDMDEDETPSMTVDCE